MKKIFTSAVIICSLLISCNNNGQSVTGSGNDDTPEKDKKISKRDFSITPQNAYNDIFLDSNAVEKFIADKKIPDSLSRRMRSFYNARNYQFAWFSSNGLTEQGLTFWNIHNYETTAGDTSLKNKMLQTKMDDLVQDSSFAVSARDKSMINTELTLTEHFIRYTLGAYEKGYVKRKEMERFIPIKKEDPMLLADSLLNKKHKDEKYFEDVNTAYKLLKEELRRYVEIAKNGGWQQLPADAKQFKKGISSPAIAALKKRLQATEDMPYGDTSIAFTDTLVMGIKRAQQTFGYKPDGIITATLLKDLNVPVQKRIEQILVNMNRMRWMPQEPEGKLILVNIPEFVLHFVDGKNKVFDMDVVVGKEGHNTMMFTGKLSTVVFSPYWNVPSSIVKKEIEPSIARNANYLESHNMERTPDGGIRQRPGGENSLGKVKFLFPNSFNIYFHDTPAKSLFSKDKRAYSHGCIRLSDPVRMAEYLLKDDSNWPPEKIMEAMNSGNEKFVRVKDPVPVFITYYTAWVDENGLLNFRDDIYKRDAVVEDKMFVTK
ncbi:MAG: L,D-transpeptidase family protein [Chitinophagaceae bacterium]|nr:L,D-transpeptidase family protein [Chitinophagaceae bacterium]